MKYWLQSLAENGFDVFTIVYIAVLLIGYHYLMRWYFHIKIEELHKQNDEITTCLHSLMEKIDSLRDKIN
tara:strand:+ start:58 stop:267 length:210 start_codon:yes stop_codon:yes gene_type:complete